MNLKNVIMLHKWHTEYIIHKINKGGVNCVNYKTNQNFRIFD